MGIIGDVPRQAKVREGMSIDPPEIVETEADVVACEGNDAALGHPRVYLTVGKEGFVDCPYCDRRFVFRPGAVVAEH